jgi:hypothetical protein
VVAEETPMIRPVDYPTVDPTLIGIYNDAVRNPAFRPILADWYETNGHPEAAALAWFGRPHHAWIAAGCDGEKHWLRRTILDMGRFLIESGVSADDARFFINRSAAVESQSPGDLILAGEVMAPRASSGALRAVEVYLYRRKGP